MINNGHNSIETDLSFVYLSFSDVAFKINFLLFTKDMLVFDFYLEYFSKKLHFVTVLGVNVR